MGATTIHSVIPVSWGTTSARERAARPWRRRAAVAMGLSLVAAVVVSVICGSKSKRVALFEGYDSFRLGEDAALRQLYDSDGERVPSAVIASQAVAESDEMPQQAAAALRSARANLEAVQHAANAAMGGGKRRGVSSVGAHLQTNDDKWQAKMDQALVRVYVCMCVRVYVFECVRVYVCKCGDRRITVNSKVFGDSALL